MDRARVLCPSISLAAHAAAAAILVGVPLLLPRPLPERSPGGDVFGCPRLDTTTVASLGGAPAGSAVRRAVPRVQPPRHTTAPAFVPPLLERDELEIDGPPGLAGLPDDLLPGDGTGVCLTNCGNGPGGRPGDDVGSVLPLPQQPAAPAPVRTGGRIREPRKLRHVAPVYPPLALVSHTQGRVVLDCVIDEDGRVSSVTVLRGHPLLESAAVEAVRQWRYTPTLLNGVRVSVLLTVTVDFTLR
jgi:TonB family protein